MPKLAENWAMDTVGTAVNASNISDRAIVIAMSSWVLSCNA